MDVGTKHTVIIGDSRNMKELSDSSIQLVITSPPYWQLKDYGSDNQIGYNHSYEQYINNLNLVWHECYRVLENGCRLCINIGDQFARSIYYGRYKVIPIRTEIIKFCETIGFDYMGAIIWQKKTTTNTTGGASVMGSFPYPRNGIISIDYEFILLFKKLGISKKPDKKNKELSKLTKEEWREYFSGHWSFGGVKQDSHIAMFPEELPKRLIKMFSFVGDHIFDPFLGSGTTSLASKNTDRNSFGYEINPEFIPIIKRKLNVDQQDMANTKYHFIEQKSDITDSDLRISALPYIFKDTLSFDKKIDIKKLQFGSKIDKSTEKREEYFSVKQIISPELLKLSNDLIVRLIGIKANEPIKDLAIRFLHEKTRNQKVFIRFDQKKYDEKDNLLCYLYLKNKTFINAHLLKNGLTNVDTSYYFKYIDKFKLLYKQNS